MAAFASSAGTQQKPGVRGVPAVMGKTVSPYVRFEVRASQKANRDLSAKRQLTRRKGRDIRDARNLAFLRRGRFPAFSLPLPHSGKVQSETYSRKTALQKPLFARSAVYDHDFIVRRECTGGACPTLPAAVAGPWWDACARSAYRARCRRFPPHCRSVVRP